MLVKDDLVDAIEQMVAPSTMSRAWAFRWIAELDALELWRDDGSASMSDWLCTRFGLKRQTALEWVRISRALADLPEVSKAFQEGRLFEEQVAALARFVTAETDQDWALVAQGMSVAELERHAQRQQRIDREQAARDTDSHELRLREDRAGRYLSYWGKMPIPQGQALRQRLEQEVAQVSEGGAGGIELKQSYSARMGDALLRLVLSSKVPDRGEAPKPEVVVHITEEALGSADVVGEIEGSSVVAAETVRRFLCHSSVRMIHWLPDGTLIGIGPATRSPTPWQMRVLWERDGGCAWLGCGETR